MTWINVCLTAYLDAPSPLDLWLTREGYDLENREPVVEQTAGGTPRKGSQGNGAWKVEEKYPKAVMQGNDMNL